jgi:hypothetical protein
MRCPLRFRGSLLVASSLLFAALTLSACSSGDTAEAGAVGTTATGPLGITYSSTYLTLENRAGVPFVEAKVEIIPRGMRPPFRTTVARIEGAAKHDVPFNVFRSADGTPFQRGNFRTRTIKVTATDVTGKVIEQEIPFE